MIDISQYSDAVRLLALTHFCGVTPRMYDALLRRFGTVEALFGLDRSLLLSIDGLTAGQADLLEQAEKKLEPAALLAQQLSDRDIRLLTQFEPEYGHLLTELNDPPPLLYVRGRFLAPEVKSVAVVGSSRPGSDGIALTSELVRELIERGVQVVSTLRGGIDSAVHLTAAANNGRSFAVLDCGVDKVEPKEGMPVAIDIVRDGGVISEYHPDMSGKDVPVNEANRLVIGMAQAVIVTEMYSDSSQTLDLVQACREIGKLLFFMINPDIGALADEASLSRAIECGAIPIDGLDKIDDIVRSLV